MGRYNKRVGQKRRFIFLRRKTKVKVEGRECVQSIGMGLSRSHNLVLAAVLNRT